MGTLNSFERKTEKTLEQIKCQEIKNYVCAVEAIYKVDWLSDKDRHQEYQEVAEKILTLLPSEIVVFELSADVYAIREMDNKQIDDSEIKDLDWVKDYASEGFK